jgi:hypothetical protein
MKRDKKKDDEPPTLMCMPALPGQDGGVKGSMLYECGTCKRPVWVAPSGQRIIREEKGVPTCIFCVEEEMKKNPEDAHFGGLREDQLEEIREATGPEGVARLLKMLYGDSLPS